MYKVIGPFTFCWKTFRQTSRITAIELYGIGIGCMFIGTFVTYVEE